MLLFIPKLMGSVANSINRSDMSSRLLLPLTMSDSRDLMCRVPSSKCAIAMAPLNSTILDQIGTYYDSLKHYLAEGPRSDDSTVIFLNSSLQVEEYASEGVIFDQFEGPSMGRTVPSVSYRIRLAAESLPIVPSESLQTNPITSSFLGFGLNAMKWDSSGFLALQSWVDTALIRFGAQILRNATGAAVPTPDANSFYIKTGPSYPNPTVMQGILITSAAGSVGLIFIGPALNAALDLVNERKSKLREFMKIMGLKDAAYWLSWITIIALGEIFPILLLSVALYATGVLGNSGMSGQSLVPILNFILGAASQVSFGILASTIANTPSVVTVLLIMWTYGSSQLSFLLLGSSRPVLTLAALIGPIAHQLSLTEILKEELSIQGYSSFSLKSLGNYPLALGLFMQFFDCILYLLLTWYISNLKGSGIDGADGAGKKVWYFPFTRSFWCAHRNRRSHSHPEELGLLDDVAGGDLETLSSPSDFQQISSDDLAQNPVVLRIQNLRKVYQGTGGTAAPPTVAVDHLNLQLQQNRIFALLGENGAGKTTTISMLTGFTAPTSGDAVVDGYSVVNNLEEARDSISICPQHDMLLDELTGRQHLMLFARLKGVPDAGLEAAVQTALQDVELEDKADQEVKSYSGGMKRRLSLAISLVADSRIVFLDEPTSGLDPVSRRRVWEMLKRKREGKCFVLTTHFLEEADVLGDRIGIMSHGHLVCAGSSNFLKMRFGAGYILTVVLDELKSHAVDLNQQENILEFVQRHVPTAKLISANGQDVSLLLPFDSSDAFPALFSGLEKNLSDMFGALSYGVSMTTLEDVFLSIAKKGEVNSPESRNETLSPYLDDIGSNGDAELGMKRRILTGDPAPLFQQLKSMFKMRAKLLWRSKWSTLASMLLPVVFALTVTLIMQVQTGGMSSLMDLFNSHANGDLIPLNVSSQLPMILPVYLNTTSSKSPPLASVQSMLNRINIDTELGSSLETILFASPNATALNQYLIFNRTAEPLNGFGALVFDETTALMLNATRPLAAATLLFNKTAFATYSIPTLQNLLFNTFFSTILAEKVPSYQEPLMKTFVSSWPFTNVSNGAPSSGGRFIPTPGADAGFSSDISLLVTFLITSAVMMTQFAASLVQEKHKKIRKQLELSGAMSLSYWAPLVVIQAVRLILAFSLVMLCVFLPFKLYQFTSEASYVVSFFVHLILFAFGVVLFNVMIQRIFSDPETSRKWLTMLNLAAGFLPFLIKLIIFFITLWTNKGALTPNSTLDQISDFVPVLTPHAAFLAGLHELSNVFQHQPKLTSFGDVWSISHLGKYLIAAFVHLILLALLNALLERRALSFKREPYRPPPKFRTMRRFNPDGTHTDFQEQVPEQQEIEPEDPDVTAERNRDSSQDPVRLIDVSKWFKGPMGRAAVYNATFSVKNSECFGLLGPNGAGKSTLISMITGEVLAGFGDIVVNNSSIYAPNNVSELFRDISVGECMQSDALFDELTSVEHLDLFLNLRNDLSHLNNSSMMVEQLINEIVHRMRLQEHRDKRSEQLSGGNKRKLSTAAALLTGAKIVLLDEPTTGMDPSMRRSLWSVLKAEREQQHSSLLLTTHSLEEAEATCGRIAIMVMGRLQCIGSNQHLKSRFGNSYRLHVVLEPTSASADALNQFVASTFPGCRLLEAHGAHFTFDVGILRSIAAAFGALESNKDKVGIQSYSISQATLEQIFMRFAKKQELEDSQ